MIHDSMCRSANTQCYIHRIKSRHNHRSSLRYRRSHRLKSRSCHRKPSSPCSPRVSNHYKLNSGVHPQLVPSRWLLDHNQCTCYIHRNIGIYRTVVHRMHNSKDISLDQLISCCGHTLLCRRRTAVSICLARDDMGKSSGC